MIPIHAITTGQFQIKTLHYQAHTRNRGVRLMQWFMDTRFTDWLPLYTWVIDHPDGVILVDTGETHATTQPEFYPAEHRALYTGAFRFEVPPEQHLAARLRALQLDPLDIRTVIITHGHMDHTGGMNDFPHARFLFSRQEYEDVRHERGYYLTGHWSPQLQLTPIDYVPEPVFNFSHSYPVTRDGRVRIIPTPGHTPGHQSVVVLEEDHLVILAGDCAFSIPALLQLTIDGVAIDEKAHRATGQQLLELAQSTPVVLLPTHDPDAARRLQNREVLPLPR